MLGNVVDGGSPAADFEAVLLRLYVSGGSHRSTQAVLAATRLSETLGPDRCELEVIDILADPAAAELGRIIATPTLERVRPEPTVRVVGGLLDMHQIARLLQLFGGELV